MYPSNGGRFDIPYLWPPDGRFTHSSQDWLKEQLLDRRVLFIIGQLDQPLALRAAAELMTLDATSTDPIDIYFDSPDGTLEAAFVLIDTMDLLQAPTRVHALGEVGGPGIGVLAVGGRRTAAPHAHFRLGEPAVQLTGTTDQLVARAEHQQRLRQRFQDQLTRATGRLVTEITDDLRRGRYLDAQEALDYRLIDEIEARNGPGGGFQ